MKPIKVTLAIVVVMYAIVMFYGCAPINAQAQAEEQPKWYRTNIRLVQTFQNEEGEVVNELLPVTQLNGIVFKHGGEIQIQEKTGLLRLVPIKPDEQEESTP